MSGVCVLHIGKTGGTALRAVIDAHKAQRPDALIEIFPHEYTLLRVASEYPDSRIAFFVRDPVQRFASGFNSRLRQGQPRYNSPWSGEEAWAFARYPDANTLAEALSSACPQERAAAARAIAAIQHTRLDYRHYLHSVATLETHRHRIAFVGSQSSFLEDVARFKKQFGISPSIMPPLDDIGAHRNPSHLNSSLSAAAVNNLRAHYSEDYEIFSFCLEIREQILNDLRD